jgi:tetratricopeptide (TPR) repeat protein
MRCNFAAQRVLPWLCLCLFAADTNPALEERLWQYRNLGKAFYENPTTQPQAVEQFRKALDLAPNSARERLNYGLALLRAGRTKEGVAELERVQKQDPSLPHTWFNLGIVLRRDGEFAKAIPEFEQMIKLAPEEPVAHYNLGFLYKQTGRADDAIREFQTATGLNPSLAAPHFQLYNSYRQAGRNPEAAAELAIFQRLKREQEGAAIPEDMEWCQYAEIYDPIDAKDGQKPAPVSRLALPSGADGQLLIDVDGGGKLEVLSWGKGVVGLASKKNIGLGGLTGVISVAAGDFDNDGLADLCILTGNGPVLYRNARGRFERVDAGLPAGRFDKAVWLDFDHDYDLDLLLLGQKPVLMRNQGRSEGANQATRFADRTADFPFVAGHAIDAVTYRRIPDSKAFDLVVSYQDRAGVLYADRLNGKYEAVALPELAPGAKWLETADLDHDGFLDIVSSAGTVVNRRGKFERANAPKADGSIPSEGSTPGAGAIRVELTGVKNLKLAYDAEVEVKAGASYQKKIYRGVPLVFDLAARRSADTVRITWPNGLIQNETNAAAGHSYTYKEAQRLSGSCPMIWTWDGKAFRFITDVLGIAPLGASSGDGQYFPVDHDEYIQIPGEALQAVDGKYRVRITEELSEVSYLDQVRLLAVDHPARTEIFTSEKWKSPPFPDFRLYGVNRRIYPKSAHDGKGADVRASLLARDGKYVNTFQHDLSGVAELHTLDLDFGKGTAPGNQAVLILNGWLDWADGSTFLAASQAGMGGLIPPYLQVKNARGEWQTVIEDMGMPDGKPKTIAVDLSQKFLSDSREIRIVTNLCVFWDEIFLGEDVGRPQALLTRVATHTANLRFRGFSETKVYPGRTQPDDFTYAVSYPTSLWNPTPGLYTRYGPVKDLLEAPDDRYAIMGSGDEVALEFRAESLLVVRPGWKRDFILKVDGWAKDRDPNTAFSQSVEPLPFHAMSSYPYPNQEQYPADEAHRMYRRSYNTRPALRLIRALVP